MSTETLFRISGIVLIVSALTGTAGPLVHPPDHSLASIPTWNWGAAHGLLALTWALRLFALPALYGRVAARAGILGLFAFLLVLINAGDRLASYLFEVNIIPSFAAYPLTRALFEVQGPPPVSMNLLGSLAMPLSLAGQIATLVFGVLIMRAWSQGRVAGLMLAVGIVASFAGFMISPRMGFSIIPVQIGFAALSLGYGLLGVALWRGQSESATRTMAVPQPA